MDTVIQYKTLFTISFLHDYFADGKLKKMIVEPTTKTRKILNQHKLIFKLSGNEISVIAQVNSDKPIINFGNFLKLSFTLKVNEPYFYNYTNISLNNFRDTIFYFSNTVENKSQNTLYLSQTIETYNSEKVYHLGSLVKYDGIIFEAIVNNVNASPENNGEEWRQIQKKIAYVTSNDKISVHKYPNYTAILNKEIQLLDYLAPTYLEYYNRLQPNIGLCLVKDKAKKIDKKVYIDAHVYQEKPLGIIEIMHRADISDNYALLNKKGEITTKNFVVHFKNRATIWRYIVRGQYAETLTDATQKYVFDKKSNSEFVSQTPIPLAQKPHKSLELALENFQKVRNLPNASPLRIIPENNKIYSNIYLNY